MTLSDLAPLANHLWQSTLGVAAVWLLTLALKKNRAAVRYWLWFAASVKFLIPFAVLVSLGSQIGWQRAPVADTAQPQWSHVAENIGRPFSIAAPGGQAVASPGANPLPLILFSVWLCGFLVSIGFWFRWWRQIRAAQKEAKALALGLPIPVLSSPDRIEPGVVGIFRPVLLLPEGIAQRLTPTQLTTVLAHEMHHVQRRDNLTAAIHMLVEAVFWFYPLVWWIRTRLVEERERACDEAVLRLGGEAEAYAEGILSVCKFYVESPLVCISGISGADLKKRVVRILARARAEKLNSGRKILLAVAAILAVAAPLIYGFIDSPQMSAQTTPQPSVESVPSFEVASIKPDHSMNVGFSVNMSPDRFTATGTTTKFLIKFAYNVRDFQVFGGPGWVDSETYDIDAKEEDSLAQKLQKLSFDDKMDQIRPLVRSLLADRFKLKINQETKELPVYGLVIAKNGPKFQEWSPRDPSPFKGSDAPAPGGSWVRVGRSEAVGQRIRMAALVRLLSERLGRIVLDKTGLTGEYSFALKWAPDENPPIFKGAYGQTSASPPPSDSFGPSIFTAVQEQLGLKLESQKGPVEVLVIDHVEKPSEN
jgi:bla regulator protein BlaR1